MEHPTPATHPSKEAVRAHLERRRAERTPPPEPGTIRDELDWHLLPDDLLPDDCIDALRR